MHRFCKTSNQFPFTLQEFIQHSDLNASGDVTLAEFIHYITEHEKKLRLLFTNLDTDRDGRIKVNELISAFRDLGIAISKNEAIQLLRRYFTAVLKKLQNITVMFSQDRQRWIIRHQL